MEGSAQEIPEPKKERPEELIVEIYRQKKERTESGLSPSQVIMSMKTLRFIRNYHSSLGSLENSLPDYIGEDTIFGLEIMIDNREGVKVL